MTRFISLSIYFIFKDEYVCVCTCAFFEIYKCERAAGKYCFIRLGSSSSKLSILSSLKSCWICVYVVTLCICVYVFVFVFVYVCVCTCVRACWQHWVAFKSYSFANFMHVEFDGRTIGKQTKKTYQPTYPHTHTQLLCVCGVPLF